MLNFKQFLENNEEPFRIVLGQRNSDQDNLSQKFIKEFIDEMRAKESPIEDETFFYDQDGTHVFFNLTKSVNSPN